jgi:hypothetical protein
MGTKYENGGPGPTPTAVVNSFDTRIVSKLDRRARALIDLLGKRPSGLIRHSIADQMQLPLSSICSLVNRLEKAGLVVVSTETRPSPYGQPATIVRLSRRASQHSQREGNSAVVACREHCRPTDGGRQKESAPESMPVQRADLAVALQTGVDRQCELGRMLDTMPVVERDALAAECLDSFWLKRYRVNPKSETVRLTLMDALEVAR